jgi:LacI family transcriptional regulator
LAKVDQQTIAEKLNLSRTTVSRCFTNHPKINPQTRAKVFQLAAKLGYSYSAPRNAQSPKKSARNTIAVLVGVDESAKKQVDTAAEIINGISEKAAAEKLLIEVHYVEPSSFLPGPRPRKIVPNGNSSTWKGVVLIYPFHTEAVRNLMTKFPTVSVLDHYDELELDSINPDQTRGIGAMVRHLHHLGHQRIGFLSWKYAIDAPWVERRLGAYVEYLYRLGLEFDPKLVLNVRHDEQISLEGLGLQVANYVKKGVTAWVCAADHQAYHLVNELKKHGVSVPGDCSVTGFDGIIRPHGVPQITTVRVAFKDLGISSIVCLKRTIENPTAPRRHIQISGQTIIGKSSAALV